jgi:para-aminobenzoate synthetase/4-amino-4-deoxychorismate lyase
VSLSENRRADLPEPDPSRGVFETLLVAGGVPCELDAHLERLRASLRALYGVALPQDAHELAHERSAGVPLGRLRLSAAPQPGGEPRLDVVVQPLARANVLPGWELGLDLRTVVADGWRWAHKWTDRLLLEALDARAAPEGALLVDSEGSVLETTRANVFAVGADGVVRTPPLDGRILPGVARARVIALTHAAGLALREESLRVEQLLLASELFATGSVRGVELRALWLAGAMAV